MRRVLVSGNSVLLAGALIGTLGGCVSTGQHVIRADDPQTVTRISKFELAADEVVVHGRVSVCGSQGYLEEPAEGLTVRPGECFEAVALNCIEQWTLEAIAQNDATFDVRGRYYSCADPFAIWFGIPSRTSHWSVQVCRPDANDTPVRGERPDWFRNRGGQAR